MLRRILLAAAVLLLLALAWTGLSGGVRDLAQSSSVAEQSQSAMQLAFGAFALLSAVTAFWGRRWAPFSRVALIMSCTLAAGLASVVWGGATLPIGVLSGFGGAAIAWGITWLLHVGERGLTRARGSEVT